MTAAAPIVVIIAGEVSKGKTTALNNIFGTDFDLPPINDVSVREVRKNERPFILVDTPGYGNRRHMKDKEIKKCIHNAVKGLDFTLLLCLSVNSGNIDNDTNRSILHNLQKASHNRIWEKCVLLFTFSDDLVRNADDVEQYKKSINESAQSFQLLMKEFVSLKSEVKTVFHYYDETIRKNSGFPGIVAVPVGKNKSTRMTDSEEYTRSPDIIPGIPSTVNWESVVFDEIVTKVAPLTLTKENFILPAAIVGGVAGVGAGAAGIGVGAGVGAAVGAGVGLAGGPVGAGAGAAVGGLIGGFVGAALGVGGVAAAATAYQNWKSVKPEDQIRSLREKIPR